MSIFSIAWQDLIGVIGVALYVGSYFLLQTKILDGNKNTYAIMNLLAPVAVLISLTESFNLASALIQICWVAISIVGISLRAWSKYSNKDKPFRNIDFSRKLM